MKLIFVNGDDYGATMFEDAFKGTSVKEIIENPNKFTLAEFGGEFVVDDENEQFWNFKVIDVGIVSDEFVKFIRNTIQDHDDIKHYNFWMENEII